MILGRTGTLLTYILVRRFLCTQYADTHAADNAGVAVVVGISIVVVACGGRIHRNSKVLVFKESRARQVRVRKRSEKRTEIIRTVPCGRKIILHVLVQQTAFRCTHRPVLTVVSEVGYWLKGNFVFAFGYILIG